MARYLDASVSGNAFSVEQSRSARYRPGRGDGR
ncbi:hypothetical protein KO516_14685 [Citreicella sp. C3M06]|nr:hypothetical protein [Citreicella sp. C3M06]